MTDVPWMDWYQSLAKPSWTPAPRTIGLIWQILYPVIIVMLDELVVYRQEYGDRGLWVRPAAMFAETVIVDGKALPRCAAILVRPMDPG